jgi:hypothetical protein
MQETNQQETMEQEKLTPEEIKARMETMEKFYDERIPFLEKQCKYEELTARIEMARYNRFESTAKFAQLHARVSGKDEKLPEVDKSKMQH